MKQFMMGHLQLESDVVSYWNTRFAAIIKVFYTRQSEPAVHVWVLRTENSNLSKYLNVCLFCLPLITSCILNVVSDGLKINNSLKC